MLALIEYRLAYWLINLLWIKFLYRLRPICKLFTTLFTLSLNPIDRPYGRLVRCGRNGLLDLPAGSSLVVSEVFSVFLSDIGWWLYRGLFNDLTSLLPCFNIYIVQDDYNSSHNSRVLYSTELSSLTRHKPKLALIESEYRLTYWHVVTPTLAFISCSQKLIAAACRKL